MLTPRHEMADMEKVDEEDENTGQNQADIAMMGVQDQMLVEEAKQIW